MSKHELLPSTEGNGARTAAFDNSDDVCAVKLPPSVPDIESHFCPVDDDSMCWSAVAVVVPLEARRDFFPSFWYLLAMPPAAPLSSGDDVVDIVRDSRETVGVDGVA